LPNSPQWRAENEVAGLQQEQRKQQLTASEKLYLIFRESALRLSAE